MAVSHKHHAWGGGVVSNECCVLATVLVFLCIPLLLWMTFTLNEQLCRRTDYLLEIQAHPSVPFRTLSESTLGYHAIARCREEEGRVPLLCWEEFTYIVKLVAADGRAMLKKNLGMKKWLVGHSSLWVSSFAGYTRNSFPGWGCTCWWWMDSGVSTPDLQGTGPDIHSGLNNYCVLWLWKLVSSPKYTLKAYPSLCRLEKEKPLWSLSWKLSPLLKLVCQANVPLSPQVTRRAH